MEGIMITPNVKRNSALIYNFPWQIAKLSWQRSVYLNTKMASKFKQFTNEEVRWLKNTWYKPKHSKEHNRY